MNKPQMITWNVFMLLSMIASITDISCLRDSPLHELLFMSEKATVPHSSTLAWKIPWTEEPGGLQSMGSLEVGHDWETSLSLFTFMHWRRKWQPTPVFWPGESQGWGALWAAVSGVAQSRTWLKRLSMCAIYVFVFNEIKLRLGHSIVLLTIQC